MSRKNSGMLVETKSGKAGRTFNKDGRINGKLPVYIATEFKNIGDEKEPIEIPVKFEEKAILCDPSTLKVIGFLD